MQNEKNRRIKKYISLICLAVLSLGIVNFFIVNSLNFPAAVDAAQIIEVHYIDVGQGDSTLIDLGDEHILIDGGDPGTGALQYIQNEGISNLDVLISTHPDQDHIGGLAEVINAISIEEVWDSGTTNTTIAYNNYITAINNKGISPINVIGGYSTQFENGATLQVLNPSVPNNSDLNNSSIVVKLNYGDTSYIFMADAETSAENEIMNNFSVDSDVLKVGHHGSASSTSQTFLNAVTPEISVISVGTNSYGHPTQTVLDRLNAIGSDVYRTDQNSDVIIYSDGANVGTSLSPTGEISGNYYIKSKNSNLVMDIYGGGTQQGTNIIQWPFHGRTNQQWEFENLGNGYYKITSVQNPNMSLDVYGGNTELGNRVIQWPYHGGTNQQWKIIENTDGTVSIMSRLSEESGAGYLLDVYGGGKDQGVNVIQWTAHYGDNQKWFLNKVPQAKDYSGTYDIRSQNSNLVMDIYGGGTQQGTNIIQWPYHGGTNQQWKFEAIGNGYYKITSVQNPNMSLDVYGGNTELGNRVIQWPYHGGTNQQWKIIENTDGTVSIMSRLSEESGAGYLLDVYGGGKDQGVNVIQWTAHYGSNQRWILENPAPVENINYTVYVTNTGTKYHRDGCQYLSQSKIAIMKLDAINQGYTPCSVCKP